MSYVMRYLYTCLMYLFTPLIILRLFWKSRRLPAYRERIGERLSIGTSSASPVDVWVHAVSLGEVVAATPLIQALLDRHWRVMVTTMTPTGSQQVLKRFGRQVSHQYVPYDLPWVIKRFFKQTQPRLGIIMETELWPNLIDQAARLSIPLLLVNARISDRAFKRYEQFGYFFKPILNQFTVILAQSPRDAARFIALGGARDCVQVAGNLKFDMPEWTSLVEQQKVFLDLWGNTRLVVIAASTHSNEEHQILSAWPSIQNAMPQTLLLIAPRHPERFKVVYELCVDYGLQTGLRSNLDSITKDTQVIVLDAMGELSIFYALSDYAFIGGSLVPVGGHNVLEAIAQNVPVFCGPYMNNAQSIWDDLSAAHAVQQVSSADDLMHKIIALHQDPARCETQVNQARMVLNANKGTLARCLMIIDKVITSMA